MASSVVTNNYLKDFDAHVQFGKGIIQGGGEKLWEDLKALGIAISSPIETLEALGKLVTSPEAMIALGIDVWKELNSKYENVYDALYSEKAYAGIEALNAGKDLGDLALTILETYGGVKGAITVSKGASNIGKIMSSSTKEMYNNLKNSFGGKLTADDFIRMDIKGDSWINPITGKREILSIVELKNLENIYGKMQLDHIYPQSLIKDLPGFNLLNSADKKTILQLQENFQPLPQKLNASKGNTVQNSDRPWEMYKKDGMDLNNDYKKALDKAQNELKDIIETRINILNKEKGK
ncbi:hypothetical protein [Aliarcobacter butzleri]|uniref:hypothetical protein n=1 Tax=Aliarcobacter butzleri TaxID=28197 RepID=UPI001EDEE626|nr:hypothetical protein [Aliarcobacter butzleri]MCG3680075.1 hypothetical protein [Aliarcobacter butzleri]